MKLLFFDMEFANGQVAGSIYSIGYIMTDENFEVLHPQTDILINPDAVWNDYVAKNILAYPMETVEAAPKFPAIYEELKKLFDEADIAVGFSVGNDTRALKKDCERYGLDPIAFWYFDTERLCHLMEEHRGAHGLAGCVQAWCGMMPENQHRSDGDAYATMLLMRALCRAKHVDPEMMVDAYPECVGESIAKERRHVARKARTKRHRSRKKPRSRGTTTSEALA